jgi:hypothetical protein
MLAYAYKEEEIISLLQKYIKRLWHRNELCHQNDERKSIHAKRPKGKVSAPKHRKENLLIIFKKTFNMRQQAINAMNNNAASYLAMGQETEAIDCLFKTLDLLSDVCKNIDESEEETNSTKYPVEPHATSVVPLFNTNAVIGSHADSSFVYNNGFVLTSKGRHHCDDQDISVKSATVIYNMALAYHRLVISTPSSPCRGGWISKAATFYEHAIQISLLGIQSTTGVRHRNATITVALASYNNLGQINFDLLSDHDTARRCFESVSYLMQSSLDEFQEGIPFSQEALDGIVSNLIFVNILTSRVAAAA